MASPFHIMLEKIGFLFYDFLLTSDVMFNVVICYVNIGCSSYITEMFELSWVKMMANWYFI